MIISGNSGKRWLERSLPAFSWAFALLCLFGLIWPPVTVLAKGLWALGLVGGFCLLRRLVKDPERSHPIEHESLKAAPTPDDDHGTTQLRDFESSRGKPAGTSNSIRNGSKS